MPVLRAPETFLCLLIRQVAVVECINMWVLLKGPCQHLP